MIEPLVGQVAHVGDVLHLVDLDAFGFQGAAHQVGQQVYMRSGPDVGAATGSFVLVIVLVTWSMQRGSPHPRPPASHRLAREAIRADDLVRSAGWPRVG